MLKHVPPTLLTKCVVIGDAAVGKSCMLISGTKSFFPEERPSTVFDIYSTNLMVENRDINIKLWDTAGQEDYDRLRPLSSYSFTDVFLICFSVDSTTSFDNIKSKWYPEIQHHAPGVPFILVGTKLDVRGEGAAGDYVTKQMGEQLREELKAYKYLECSARTQEGLKQMLVEAAQAILDSKPSWINENESNWELFCEVAKFKPYPSVLQTPQSARALLDKMRALGHNVRSYATWAMHSDAARDLFCEAEATGAHPTWLVNAARARAHLDLVRETGQKVNALPSWATKSEQDENTYNEAVNFNAPLLLLSSSMKAREYLDVMRKQGRAVIAQPSWAVDARTIRLFERVRNLGAAPQRLATRDAAEEFLKVYMEQCAGPENRHLWADDDFRQNNNGLILLPLVYAPAAQSFFF